jgi:hypothetical protein
MITIFRNSWHFKLYRFYQRRFNNDYNYPNYVNLCPYMRTLLLWLPLQYVVRVAIISLVTLVFLFGFVGSMSLKQVLIMLALTIASMVILGGIIFGIFWLVEREPSEPTTLIGAWIKAKHDKICPSMRVL